jgi:hypothetical protein
MAGAAFNKKKDIFTSEFDLNLSKKPLNCYICGLTFFFVDLKLGHTESRSETPGKY